MFMEAPTPEKRKSESIKEYDLSFTKTHPREGVVKYVFNQVEIGFDTSGKNYKDLPEILFRTFDENPGKGSFDQPEVRREGVDMAYISACIQEAMEQEQYTKVWFYPYGDDVVMKNGETDEDFEKRKEIRREARLRLFQEYGEVAISPSGYGYTLSLQ